MTLTGTGSLRLDGAQIQSALRYTVTETRNGLMAVTRGSVEIEPDVAGTIISGLGPNSDLVLVLEDGRGWPCTLKNSDGDLLGRGEIR